jgi:hypothetical protein
VNTVVTGNPLNGRATGGCSIKSLVVTVKDGKFNVVK